MVVGVFFYLLVLSCILYKKAGGVDMSCYIVIIYALSAFFGVLADELGLLKEEFKDYSVSMEASILYCFLITVCVLPIAKYSNAKVFSIVPIKNPKFLLVLSKLAIVYFVVYVFFSYPEVVRTLSGDIGEMRREIYAGETQETWMVRLPIFVRPIFSFFNLFFGCPWIFLFLGFYIIVVQKLPVKYGIMLMSVSLMGPISGIIGVDRSQSAYWIISLVACYLFYAPFMTTEQKSKCRKIGVLLIGILFFYLIIATNSRFGDRDDGADGSVILYLGQSYFVFCYFFDTFDSDMSFLNVVLPFSSYYIFGSEFRSIVPIQDYITMNTGVFVGRFFTFFGHIMVIGGKWLMVTYTIFLLCVSYNSQKRRNLSLITLKRSFVYLFCSSVMFLGVFTHNYAGVPKTFSVLVIYFLIRKCAINDYES